MMIRHAVAATALALGACAAWAEQTIDKRAPAQAAGEVEVSNVAGSVSISGWDRNEVHVTGTLGDDVERLEFVSNGGRTLIKVIAERRGHWGGGDIDTELSIRVPKASRLDVNNVSADVSVKGVTGPQRLQTVSGEVSTEVGREDVEVKTVSGDVSLRGQNQAGVLTVTTVSGNINASRIAGEVTANSTSGEIELSLDKLSRARVRTVSGDLSLSGALAPKANVDTETISGETRLDLRGKVNAEFDIQSFSGDIDNCFGPEARATQEYGPGSELHFTEGDGSARVRVSTLSGDISVCGSDVTKKR